MKSCELAAIGEITATRASVCRLFVGTREVLLWSAPKLKLGRQCDVDCVGRMVCWEVPL